MKQLIAFVIGFMLLSCSNDDDSILVSNILSDYLLNNITETGAVIACAARDENTNAILTFYYPEDSAINVRYYETETADVNKLDYSKYKHLTIDSEPFFNGYLGKFTRNVEVEKWIIITYELNNEIKLSNPIRTKQIQKPTVWNTSVNVNLDDPLMPYFSWQANAFGDNAIYFQVVSSTNNDLVSGTYTYDANFQFYDLTNVVLKITEGTPELENNSSYNFTLMDVSIDNWVNLVSQKTFSTP